MTMTYKERLKKALSCIKTDEDSIDRLIAYAYYAGREQATREYSREVKKVLKAQKERASSLRYNKLGLYVQGDIDYIRSGDYAGCYQDEFGGDLTDL